MSLVGNGIGVRPTLKYEDDLKIFRQPLRAPTTADCGNNIPEYEYDREEALRRITPLQIPWHKEKRDREFHYQTTFISYYWDLVLRRVSLNDEKRLKFHNRVRVFIDSFNGHCCTLNDVEKIHGSLCHVAFIYVEGRSRLPSLSNFASSFKGNELL
jgi:hypothetical protein